MEEELAESISEVYICPFCISKSYQWSEIVKYMIDKHTDEEAIKYMKCE